MKKIMIAVFVLLVGSYGAHAQDNTKKSDTSHHHMMTMKDCVMMKDGKMMVIKGGKNMEMTQDMTLSDGTTVMKDGNIKMKDGKTTSLKNGDCIYMDGKIKRSKMKSA